MIQKPFFCPPLHPSFPFPEQNGDLTKGHNAHNKKNLFLPAAKLAGHRTESVVLLVVVLVVLVVGVSLSLARISYPSTLKKDCVGKETKLPDILLSISFFFFYIMATLFTFFPTHSFECTSVGQKSNNKAFCESPTPLVNERVLFLFCLKLIHRSFVLGKTKL